MRSWNMGLCPECGSDRIRLVDDYTHSTKAVEVPFFCGSCKLSLILGMRTIRGRTEFAWLYDDHMAIHREDGSKPTIAFLTETKEDA